MIDYKTLKHSNNGMPTYDGYLGSVLLVASRRNMWAAKDLQEAVNAEVHLPKELAKLRYASNHDFVSINRIKWAISYLKLSGFLNTIKRGIYEITPAGRNALEKYGVESIHKSPQFILLKKKGHENKKNNLNEQEMVSELSNLKDLTENKVETWINTQETKFKAELLTKMRSVDPYDFEHMMMELLNTMGYRGTNGKSLVTQKSNDGGIDGIINQDALGLQTISIQVKRYNADNIVGRPEIDAFYGAIGRQQTNSGVFITTSSFTESARQAAKQFNIALVDGEMLTNLMIQYRVGVKSKKKFELYQIDSEFFI